MSLLCMFLTNRNINPSVMLAGLVPIAFSVMSVNFGLYSCKVSSGLCLSCRSLAAFTLVAMGEYTASSFLFI